MHSHADRWRRLVAGAVFVCALVVGVVAQQTSTPRLSLDDSWKDSLTVRAGGGGRWLAANGAVTFDGESVPAGGGGRWLAAIGLAIFDGETGRVTRWIPVQRAIDRLEAPRRSSDFVAHPTQDIVVVLTDEGTLRAIDVNSGATLWETPARRPLDVPRRSAGDPVRIVLSRDGSTLTALLGPERPPSRKEPDRRLSGYLGRWDALSGAEVGRGIDLLLNEDEAFAISGDAAWYSLGRQLFDATTGKKVKRLASDVVLSYASRQRAVIETTTRGDDPTPYCLVDVSSGTRLHCWREQAGAELSPDGSRLLITTRTAEQSVIDLQDGLELGVVNPVGPTWTFTTDGAALVAVNGRRRFIGSPAPDQRLLNEPPMISDDLKTAATTQHVESGAAFTPDGRLFVAQASDGIAYVWDVGSGDRLPFELPVRGVAGPSLGRRMMIEPVSGRDGRAAEWPLLDVATVDDGLAARMTLRLQRASRLGQPEKYRKLLPPVPDVVAGIVCTSDNHEFDVMIADDGHAVLRSTVRDQRLADLTAARVDLSQGCSISGDGRRLVVTGVVDGKAKLPAPTSDVTWPLDWAPPRPALPAGPSAKARLLGMIPKVGPYAQDIVKSRGSATPSPDSGLDYYRAALLAPPANPLVVLDVAAGRIVAALRNESGGAGRFPMSAADVLWSPDGRFLVGQDRITSSNQTMVTAVWTWTAADGRLASPVIPPQSTRVQGFTTGRPAQLVLEPVLAGNLRLRELGTNAPDRVTDLTGEWANAARNQVVSIGGGNGRSIRETATTRLLGKLDVFPGGDWLVSTPSGLFDGSPGAWQRLTWHTPTGTDSGDGALFFNEYYQPGLLADLLHGRVPRAVSSIADRDRRQPTVTLDARVVNGGTAAVSIRVRPAPSSADQAPPAGARDLRLFRNGSLVRSWRGELQADDSGVASIETTVPLANGLNTFTAYAFNRDDIKSADAIAAVTAPPVASRKPVTYVIAIGVNRYESPALNLRYAVPDATAIGELLAGRQRALGDDREVRLVQLLDADATRQNILLAIERLAGSSGPLPTGTPRSVASLSEASPEDAVVLYFAGHGVARGDRFHLIPSDVRFTARAGTAEALEQVLAGSITDRDLEQVLERVGARDIALIIDACQSGQALGPEGERFGPMNSRGLAQLAYEKGMSILVASQAYQAALESARLGHGFLTFALTEALEGRVADRTPPDGQLTVAEWFAHAVKRVPELQADALSDAESQGRELRFAPESPAALQTPRVFTKRDAAGPAFVVARP